MLRKRFIPRHCDVRPSTPHSSGVARLACGSFYDAVPNGTFFDFLRCHHIWLPTCLREEPAAAGKQLGRNEQKRGAMSLNPLLYQLVNICRSTGEVFSSANNDAYFINNSVMMLVRGEMNMDDIVQIVLMFCSFTCSCGMAHTCRCQRNTP